MLRTVGGSALPHLARSDPSTQVWIVADTLVFDGSGRAPFTEVTRLVTFASPGGSVAGDTTTTRVAAVPCTVHDHTIVFGSPCREQPGTCPYAPQGTLLSDGRLELYTNLSPPYWYFSPTPLFLTRLGA
jgi:hypothetical protein